MSTLSKNKLPIGTAKPHDNKNGQSLIRIGRMKGPLNPCQIFVIIDGPSNKSIAVERSLTRVNKARLIVGNPIPIIPLAIPAKKKIPSIIAMLLISNTNFQNFQKYYPHVNSPPKDYLNIIQKLEVCTNIY